MKEQRYITTLQGNKYIIDTILGSGGFGNTYLATQVILGRKVAIKEFFMKEYCDREEASSQVIVHTDSSRQIVERYKQKFLKEAQMIASLKNEHIIQIHDIFEENGTAYYVMEYVQGGSLKDKVEREGALPEDVAIKYIGQIAEALEYLHRNNILHLDVKPANILIDEDDRAILIDFGISKHYDSEGGQTSTTPAGISKGYAPIEQYQQGSIANFSPATDVYSLGATLLYLLTGQTPPDAMEVTNEGLNEKIFVNISSHIRDAIVLSMQARRKDRPQSISAFQDHLKSRSIIKDVDKYTSEDTIIPSIKNSDKISTNKQIQTRNFRWLYIVGGLVAILISVYFYITSNSSDTHISSYFESERTLRAQQDSVYYLIGVNLGSFIKGNNIAESLEQLNWKEIQSGLGDFMNAEGNPHDSHFGSQFRLNPDLMTSVLNRHSENVNKMAPETTETIDSVSYYLGVNFGSFIKGNNFAKSEKELNYKLIRKGIQDFLVAKGDPYDDSFGKQFMIDPNLMGDILNRYLSDRQQQVANNNLLKEKDFLKKNALKDGIKTTSSGLQYKIIRPGGEYKVKSDDTVIVNYKGTLIDGTIFDENDNIEFAANRVIKGWTEGLGLLGEGGKAIFYIPSELAYGERGNSTIEPNSTLIFEVEVLKIKKKNN